MPRIRTKRLLIAAAVLVVVVPVVLLVAVVAMERTLLYPAALRPAPAEPARTVTFRRLWVEHEDGRTPADLYTAPDASAGAPAPLVVFVHGSGELIEDWAITADRPGGLAGYLNRGWNVLAIEYRGAGSAGGKTTMEGMTADAIALHDLALKQPEVDADRVILHGRSMGGGVVAEILRRRPAAGVVLESTYTRITDVTKRMGIPTFLNRDRWDVLSAVEDFAGPVVVVHARSDAAIPFEQAERNLAAAADGVLIEDDGLHHEVWPDERYGEVVDALRARVPRLRASEPPQVSRTDRSKQASRPPNATRGP